MIRKKFKIYLIDAALDDLNRLVEFYKKLMFKFAKNLILELDQTFKTLQANPHTFSAGYDGQFGIINLRKYPVEVFYHIDGQQIIILAIQHKNFNPDYWIERV